MKVIAVFTLIASSLIAGCASSSGTPIFLPGSYTLTGHDENGVQIGKAVKIDVPFNDPSFAIGVTCMDGKTVTAKATTKNGGETIIKCPPVERVKR